MEPNHPWDGHDQEDQAEARYNVPLHAQNQLLETENLRLKRLLREAGIPWNDRVASHPGFQPSVNAVSSSGSGSQPSLNSRTTVRRSSRLSAVEHVSHSLPHLPVEVILRIMEYALYSAEPIIDPLCKLTNETLTVAEAKRGPQIAFGFLATCKAYRVEGKRFFWTRNIFTFTSPEALRRFADLDESLRQSVRRINLRVIARYYDDEERDHKVTNYHSCFKKAQSLPIIRRHKEANRLARSGFRSYAWAQVIDFLDALRAPFDPTRPKGSVDSRPRLLPQLTSMRMDFVNFPQYFLPSPDSSFHDIAAHEMGYSLNELMVTGLPTCDIGHVAGHDLQGMLKDDGLFIYHEPAYFQQKRSLKFFRPSALPLHFAVVRAYRRTRKMKPKAKSLAFPVVPEETGHPESHWKKRKTIWKRVPISRDGEERKWVEFDRYTGNPTDELEDDSDEDVCPNCGIIHGDLGSGETDQDSDHDSDDSNDSELF